MNNKSNKNKILYFVFFALLTLFSRILLISSNIDQYDTAMFVGSVKTKVLIHAPGYVPYIMFSSMLNKLIPDTVLCFSLTNTLMFFTVAFFWVYSINKKNVDKYSFFYSLMFLFVPSTWLYSVIGMSDGSQFALSCIVLILMFFSKPRNAKDTRNTLITIYFVYSILLGIKSIHIIILPIIILYTYQCIRLNHLSQKKYFFLSFFLLIIGISSWIIPQKFYYDDSSINNNSISIIKRDLRNYALFGNYYKNLSDIFLKLKELVSFSPYRGLKKNIFITVFSFSSIFILSFIKITISLLNETKKTNKFIKNLYIKNFNLIYPIYYIFAYGLFYLILFAPRTRYLLPTIPATLLIIYTIAKTKVNNKYLNYIETFFYILIIISYIRVGYINIYPYHKYPDGRTASINAIKQNTLPDDKSIIIVNQRSPGRLDMKAYLDYYLPKYNYQIFNQENILDNLDEYLCELGQDQLYNKVFLVDQNLSSYLSDNFLTMGDTDVFYSGKLVSKSYRTERVIDDPQSNVETVEFLYDKDKKYLWKYFNTYQQDRNFLDIFGNKISYKMVFWPDQSINPAVFLHPDTNGSKIVSAPFYNDLYDFLRIKASNLSAKGNGANLNVYLGNKLVSSQHINSKNNYIDLSIPITKTRLSITIETLPNSDNSYDWIVITPYLE